MLLKIADLAAQEEEPELVDTESEMYSIAKRGDHIFIGKH
jgi:hypothetical protein